MNWNPISTITESVAGYFNKRTERKQAAESAQAKLMMKREGGDQQVTFTDQEWEALSKRNENETWKDEYVTIIITMPIVFLYGAVFYSSLTGDETASRAANDAIVAIKTLIPNYEESLYIVILAAVGIKGVKSVVRR